MKRYILITLMWILPWQLFAQKENMWVGAFSKGTGYTQQGYDSRASWSEFRQVIESRWNNNYYLIGLGEGR